MRGSWEDNRTGCISATNSVHIYSPKEEQFFELLEKADKERMEVTVAFSFIREDRLAQTEQLLTRLDEWCEQQETSGRRRNNLRL